MRKCITPEDILPTATFAQERTGHKKRLETLKKPRRVCVGPFAAFYFENYDTLWWQIQEMLRIEQGGAEQLADEIEAYAPLLPQGSDWRTTMMFEIPDAAVRKKLLAKLGHIEKHITLQVDEHIVTAHPTGEDQRTTEAGKTSAVHFLRFSFTETQKQLILEGNASLTIAITHPHYTHNTLLSQETGLSLRADLAA